MAWDPSEPTFAATARTIFTRRAELAREHYETSRKKAVNELSARGLSRSGAMLRRGEELGAEAIQVFADGIVSELHELVTDSVAGHSIPIEAIQWIRDVVTERIRRLEHTYTEEAKRHRVAAKVTTTTAGAAATSSAQRCFRDLAIEIGKLELRARSMTPPSTTAAPKPHDVFISHASEDKSDVAEPLALALQSRGFSVWLDKFELTIGDPLLSSIDRGLKTARYSVVILSHAFFHKHWTQLELNALATIQASEGRKKILPVWHGLEAADVATYSPLMGGLLGARTSIGIPALANEIERVLRPAADSNASANGDSEETPVAPSAVVDLSERLRKTEEELEALRTSQQPRSQRIHGPNFVVALREHPAGKAHILRVRGDAEAHDFGQRFYGLLIQTEWKTEPPKDLNELTPAWGLLSAQVSQSLPPDMRVDERQPQGLLLMVSSVRTEAIDAMIRAMQAAGLGCGIGVDTTLPADSAQIVIGSNPARR